MGGDGLEKQRTHQIPALDINMHGLRVVTVVHMSIINGSIHTGQQLNVLGKCLTFVKRMLQITQKINFVPLKVTNVITEELER